MRNGWTSAALKNVCIVDKGKHNGECLPYVGLEHIESGTGRFVGSLEPTTVKSATFRFTPSHVLYGRLRPYLNKVLLPDFDGHCSSEIFPLRVNSSLNRQYLYYWLTWEPVVKEIDKTSTGARMPRANVNKLLDFELPLPPLPEQKRIVAILDEAFAGIATVVANTEKNLANARELFESYLNAVFSWPDPKWRTEKLGDVCTFLNGFAFKSKDAVGQSDVQLIRMGNLYKNELNLERKPVFYPSSYAKHFERYVLAEGDLIMSLTGTVDKEDYGYTVEVPRVEKVLLLNQRIAKLDKIRQDLVDRKYLLHYLRSRSFLDRLYATARGVRQANLSTVSMKQLSIALPRLTDQEVLSEKFDALEDDVKRLELLFQRKLAVLNELKQSLLQKAFSGELTAVPQDEIEDALA